MRKLLIGVALAIIELILYLAIKPPRSSLFIIIWILVFFIATITNIFGKRFDESYRSRFQGGFGGISRYELHVDSTLDPYMEDTPDKLEGMNKDKSLRFKDPITLLYLFLFIINLFIFIKNV